MNNPQGDSTEAEQPDREELQRKLDAMEKELRHDTQKLTSVWQLGIGGVVVNPVAGSGLISGIYFVFNGCCLVAGIVLILYGTVAQNVGVALIVGSIFSIGAFAAQFWMVTVEQERSVDERIKGVDSRIMQLQETYREIIRLRDQIDQVKNISSDP
jgi:hypothetical protein